MAKRSGSTASREGAARAIFAIDLSAKERVVLRVPLHVADGLK
jgi:hypothetical protein